MFRNNRRNLSELNFPLLSELRRASKKDFAKAKLLTGEPCLKVSDNKCNYIKLVNGKYFISLLSYDSFKVRFTRIEKEVGYIFNKSYLSKVTKVSGD